MYHTQNPAGQGGADCKAQQLGNPFSAKRAENKAAAIGRASHCLNPAISRWSAAVPDTVMAAAFLKALARQGGAS
jgi:hypothetical protein